ncbi:hypothetical protein HMI56_001317 [Coelomomyces lativittatus]|nr:hypothetical protein HMI56_001317 [Coelomomyces lativittatus]
MSASATTPLLLPSSSPRSSSLSSPPSSCWHHVVHLLKRSKLNWLLVFMPLGFFAGMTQMSPVVVFWINFLAILPLADMLGHSTEEIASKTNESIGGLLNATFGNAVELIVSVAALQQGMIKIVQTSLLGSVLANLLLVNGACFLLGGLRYNVQHFNITAANTSTSLLALCVMSLLIPAAFVTSTNVSLTYPNLLTLSHGTAVVLLLIYFLYLGFQLKTHAYLFRSESFLENESEEPENLGTWSLPFAAGVLGCVTFLISVHSDFMVASIEGFTQQWGLTQSFVGVILLPIVGNATEHLSAITMARKDKMNLALSISIGSSMQIALFVIPLMVVLGWILGQPMTLYFESFDTIILAISVLIVNYLIQDGNSNWLEGAMLLGVLFFFRHEKR